MKQKVISIGLFGKKGLDNALKKLNLKKIKCSICGKVITKEEISAFYPKKNGVGICCDKAECFIIVLYETKKVKKSG